MFKTTNIVVFAVFFILGLFSLALAEESMTITTYYPSPYGSYNELTSTSNAYFATTSGKVGIGTAVPKGKFDVAGSASLGTYGGVSTPPANGLIVSGNVGVGTASPGSYKFNVAGTIYTSGGCTGCSDARWKMNIMPISSALDKIMGLQGKQFNWKAKEYPNMFFHEGLDYGLVAQDTEKILPEIVYEDHGYKYIRYDRLSAILIEAVKEQQGQIRALKQEINELKAELESK